MADGLVAWRGEYDPLTPLGVARFATECAVAPAMILRGAGHVIGTLQYAEDREAVRSELKARYRPLRFVLVAPAIPVRTEFLVRFWTAFFALACGLVIWAFNGVGASAALTAIAAANWGLLIADPALFAVEHHLTGGS